MTLRASKQLPSKQTSPGEVRSGTGTAAVSPPAVSPPAVSPPAVSHARDTEQFLSVASRVRQLQREGYGAKQIADREGIGRQRVYEFADIWDLLELRHAELLQKHRQHEPVRLPDRKALAELARTYKHVRRTLEPGGPAAPPGGEGQREARCKSLIRQLDRLDGQLFDCSGPARAQRDSLVSEIVGIRAELNRPLDPAAAPAETGGLLPQWQLTFLELTAAVGQRGISVTGIYQRMLELIAQMEQANPGLRVAPKSLADANR